MGRRAATYNPGPCSSEAFEKGDAMPSVYDHLDLLMSARRESTTIPLSATKSNAFRRMAELARTMQPKGDIFPSRMLNEFASCVDTIFFGSKLAVRCDIFWGKRRGLRRNAQANTYSKNACVACQQVARAEIVLDPYRPSSETIANWRKRVLCTLLHELCHAYIRIFVDRSSFNIDQAIEVFGLGGHGAMWQNLFGWIAWLLRAKRILNINMSLYLNRSVQHETSRMEIIYSLVRMIDAAEHSTDEIEGRLATAFNISTRRARLYRKLRHDQLLLDRYSTLEIVVRVSRSMWPGNYR